MTELIFEKTVLMLLAIFGINAPAATDTKPAMSAYSIRSWPCLFFQMFLLVDKCHATSSSSLSADGRTENQV